MATSSSLSSSSLLDDQDESVRIAVKALGDMRNGHPSARETQSANTPALSVASTSQPTTSLPSPSVSSIDAKMYGGGTALEPEFVKRMSHLPLVNSALRVYEQGKASSRVVKYGAEMMESGVKTISKPVIDRLPVNVEQLDEFACRQLDRLDRYRRPSCDRESSRERGRGKTRQESMSSDRDVSVSPSVEGDDAKRVGMWIDSTSSYDQRRSPTPTPEVPVEDADQQVAQRSRWHTVLLEAGGLSAALSEESLRRLRYCLSWLQYATAHIDAQIVVLRNFAAALQERHFSNQIGEGVPLSEAHMHTLAHIRQDIVHTVRQVVDVVGKYAGGASLPEPARQRVKGFILTLPKRWAAAMRNGASAAPRGENERESVAAASAGRSRRHHQPKRERGVASVTDTPQQSPTASPRIHPRTMASEDGHRRMTTDTAMVAAQRILTLATESLDMMRGVTGVVKDSLDRADAWVGRLRTVGIRGASEGEETDAERESVVPPSLKRRDSFDIPGPPTVPVDAPSPDVRLPLSRMSLDEEDEAEGSGRMDVDPA
ncbi:Opi1-domain-containing protein [Guyanagaster necrorhizus]|uniref:Opi1-domain-containing protein n=1 Tax=Guyanagaster necrorhizus TaxID=856835 RepID=A0A9P7VP21_9AGAR|nr:Opi1-domain-containing protein [Guyanagaster necrorhizus MCA 3950]KAG7443384.1 Opi1-domain-containing protein [Guyanagaster necrorhizus MCA 3950]